MSETPGRRMTKVSSTQILLRRRGLFVSAAVGGIGMACQTWVGGRSIRESTRSPLGPLPPYGQRVVLDLLTIFASTTKVL
ncbi:hypothetical protein [Micromonospora sp. NPDC005173]|uniref:hypothetical protein n=1 Tax=Micromonospora sp. NPDC005173 TaxID=3157165 RepID=UPI0033B0AF2D